MAVNLSFSRTFDPANPSLSSVQCIANCVPEGAQKPLLIYLFLRLLGMNADTTTLNSVLRSARCIINCIPEGAQMGVLNYLATQIVSGGSLGSATYSGTTAQRDATTPSTEGTIWVLTDSNPAYQISVWNGSAWV